jgi:hypothetical protein
MQSRGKIMPLWYSCIVVAFQVCAPMINDVALYNHATATPREPSDLEYRVTIKHGLYQSQIHPLALRRTLKSSREDPLSGRMFGWSRAKRNATTSERNTKH